MYGHIKLNHVPSPPDVSDRKLLLSPRLNASLTVDLSKGCSSIKNQGSFGACTAFASIAAMEYIYNKYIPEKVQDLLSERFTYYVTRVYEGVNPVNDTGAFIRDTIKMLVTGGSCLEGSCPYILNNPTTLSGKPSPQAYQEAMTYQVLSYANIQEDKNALATIKTALSSDFPVICGFTCYQNLFTSVGGVIPLPQGNIIGGHAICLVGYDDNKSLFKFKNSWGTGWGDAGYGYLPYGYLSSGNMSDIWVIYSQENKDVAIGVTKPDPKKIDKEIRSKILTYISNSDQISYAAIQKGVENTIINPSTLSNQYKLILKQFTQRVIAAIQMTV